MSLFMFGMYIMFWVARQGDDTPSPEPEETGRVGGLSVCPPAASALIQHINTAAPGLNVMDEGNSTCTL